MPRRPKERIICVRSFQNGKVIYNAFLTPQQTKLFLKVDYIVRPSDGSIANKDIGYQRGQREKDAKKFSDSLARDGITCTNALSANDRFHSFEYIPAYSRFPDCGHLVPKTKNAVLFCTDGGCRKLGLEDAAVNHGLTDFSMPVVITQLTKKDERRGFIDINTNARKVNSLVTSSVLFQTAKNDGIQDMSEKEILKAVSYGVTEALDTMSEDYGVLNDMLLMAGDKKYGKKIKRSDPTKIGKRTLKASSFVDVLCATGLIRTMCDKIYQTKTFDMKVSLIADELNMFWHALKEITFPMWGKNKNNYAFMQAIGLRAMATIFRFIRINMEIENEEISIANFAIYLESSTMLRDHKKWLSSNGIKELNITDPNIINKSMQDKRGTSYGTVVGNLIIDEMCKKQNLHRERVYNAFSGRRFRTQKDLAPSK